MKEPLYLKHAHNVPQGSPTWSKYSSFMNLEMHAGPTTYVHELHIFYEKSDL
jgi:hypothetical protein